ncbi:SLBB domain-containing protein [Desulfogranum japonicum]|uniref:SLBB domain-containing protein n=1 Tax=Desulfogranum japonicum TaxID=231447 RepID=UPI00048FEF96|nr:SLBB domain-containing protein [Desulfogranum japonicum]
MQVHKVIAILLFILIASCYSTFAASEYVVGPEDVLDVSVYDHPEMTSTVRVDGRGMVILPLLDEVKVAGLTIGAVSKKITDLLADGYIINPQVNVFVKTFRDQKAVILGQVLKPGLYELRTKTTLLELISQAGGLTPEAGDLATLKRETKEGVHEMKIDLKKLVDQGDTSLNVQVMDGDKVFIVKAGIFYVTGEVKKPDSYKYQDDLTLIKAVALAGGFTDIASTSGVKIVRKINGKEEVLKRIEMDEPVLPNDVIVVPESFF